MIHFRFVFLLTIALLKADESFVKLTDMSSIDSIENRLQGFDAAILATSYALETRPVTGGSYDKTPNDKTTEFYMDRPSSGIVFDSLDQSFELFCLTLEASRAAGIKRLIVIETDNQFERDSTPGDKYLDLLNTSDIPYSYIRPNGKLENFPSPWTFAKGRPICLCFLLSRDGRFLTNR